MYAYTCVCMRVCVDVGLHMCVYADGCICVYELYGCACVYVCMQVYMCVYLCVYVKICMCVLMGVCVFM